MRFLSSLLASSALLASTVSANPFSQQAQRDHQIYTEQKIYDAMEQVRSYFQDQSNLPILNNQNFTPQDVSLACLGAIADLQATITTGCATATPTTGAPASSSSAPASSSSAPASSSSAPASSSSAPASSSSAPASSSSAPASSSSAPASSSSAPASSSSAPASGSSSSSTTPPPTTLISNVCASTSCLATVQAKIQTTQGLCANSGTISPQNAVFISAFTQLANYFNFGCSTDAQGNFCLNAFLQAGATLQTLSKGNIWTTAQLSGICTPCTLKVAAALGSNPAATSADLQLAANLNLLCTKNPDNTSQYCIQYYQTQLATYGQTQTPTDFPAYYCSECFGKIANAQSLLTSVTSPGPTSAAQAQQAAAFASAVQALCVNGPSSTPCAALLPSFTTDLAAATQALLPCAPAIAPSNPTCPPACSTAIVGQLSKYGCCFGSIINAVGASSISLLPQIKAVLGVCNLSSYLNLCTGSVSKVSITLDVPNLLFSFYQANKAAVTSALTLDLANAAGVVTSQVTISAVVADSTTSTTPGCSISVSFQTTTDTQNTSVQNTLNTELASGLSFPVTAQSFAAASSTAFASPSSGVVANPTTSSQASGAGSAAPTGNTNLGDASSLSISITGMLATVIAGLALTN